jgi:hypothetical protein
MHSSTAVWTRRGATRDATAARRASLHRAAEPP